MSPPLQVDSFPTELPGEPLYLGHLAPSVPFSPLPPLLPYCFLQMHTFEEKLRNGFQEAVDTRGESCA